MKRTVDWVGTASGLLGRSAVTANAIRTSTDPIGTAIRIILGSAEGAAPWFCPDSSLFSGTSMTITPEVFHVFPHPKASGWSVSILRHGGRRPASLRLYLRWSVLGSPWRPRRPI